MLDLTSVDAGRGWLIFALPPAEVAVHPTEENDRHELYLMCDDIQATVRERSEKGIECAASCTRSAGACPPIALPGGGKLGLYQPRASAATPVRGGVRRRAGNR